VEVVYDSTFKNVLLKRGSLIELLKLFFSGVAINVVNWFPTHL